MKYLFFFLFAFISSAIFSQRFPIAKNESEPSDQIDVFVMHQYSVKKNDSFLNAKVSVKFNNDQDSALVKINGIELSKSNMNHKKAQTIEGKNILIYNQSMVNKLGQKINLNISNSIYLPKINTEFNIPNSIKIQSKYNAKTNSIELSWDNTAKINTDEFHLSLTYISTSKKEKILNRKIDLGLGYLVIHLKELKDLDYNFTNVKITTNYSEAKTLNLENRNIRIVSSLSDHMICQREFRK